MGGIFVAISREGFVAPLIRRGLFRLSHRGVDGAGIATLHEGRIYIKKDAGRVEDVHRKLNLDDLPGYLGIGHVRSATHGRPAYENTHPFLDCRGVRALVMDGVVYGYETLVKRIEGKHRLSSRTDAEVLLHILEDEFNNEEPIKAIQNVVKRVRGYYAVAVLDASTERIYVFTVGNPLVIGVGVNEYFVSSEEQALSDLTKDMFYVEPGFLVILSRDGYEMYDLNTGTPVKPALLKPSTIIIELAKGSFAHFMLKEIYETPEVLARTLYILQREYLNDASNVILKAKNIFIVGSGTSYHAGLIGRYYLQSMSNVKADVVPAGEFLYEAINYVEPGTVIIAISQSGESSDIIRVVRASKRRGAVILGIVNRLGSTLMRESNVYLPVGAGPEVAVPATKTFTGTISILLQLAGYAGGKFDEVRGGIEEVRNVLINNLDAIRAKAAEVAKELKNYDNAYVISGGPLGMPLAMEMALKLKEAARVHAEAVNLREFKHGPMTLIEREFPTFLISIPGEFEDDVANIASEIWARGGTTILITSNKMHVSTDYRLKVTMPTLEERRYLTPLLYAPIIQILSYELGVARGLDVDNPKNLTKVVTT